jgi:hypothetical protein
MLCQSNQHIDHRSPHLAEQWMVMERVQQLQLTSELLHWTVRISFWASLQEPFRVLDGSQAGITSGFV